MNQLQVMGPAGMLNVDDGGSGGLPVVFIHSAGGNTTHWDAQLAHLRKTRRALAIDLRGHGLSEAPGNDDYKIVSQARDIDAAVNRLGIRRFILVGHSMGGSISVAYAGFHPDRVAGLIVVDSGGDPIQFPEKQKQQILKAMESDAYPVFTEIYWGQLLEGSATGIHERVMDDMKKMPKKMVISQVKALFQFDPKPSLSRYKGIKFAVVTPKNNTRFSLHNLQPYFPHEVVNGTGHWIHLDRPDEFNRILDGFLLKIGQPVQG